MNQSRVQLRCMHSVPRSQMAEALVKRNCPTRRMVAQFFL